MKSTDCNAWFGVNYDNEPCVVALKKELKRKDILRKHTESERIWQAPNGRWCSYLPEPTKTHKKKLLSCRTQELLEDKIIEYYGGLIPTFEKMFNDWNDHRLEMELISHSTHDRGKSTFNRLFGDIAKEKITDITIEEYTELLERKLRQYKLTAPKFGMMLCQVKGTVNRAKKLGYVGFTGIDVVNSYHANTESKVYPKRVNEDLEVYTEEETTAIMVKLAEEGELCDYALLLMFATGIRIGEAVALRHDAVHESSIDVRRTETAYHDANGKNVRVIQDFPKTKAGIRTVYVPDVYKWILEKIKTFFPESKYIFWDDKQPVMNPDRIRKRLYKICDDLGIPRKSPHKIRKTYCTILLDAGADRNFIQQQVGHAAITTTESFYHYNRKTDRKKIELLNSVEDFSKMGEIFSNVAL